ncbi:bifunctional pyr operon transcriptional regulator/uracil phosphoribosyltransferase PyrR [Paraburkholderia silviterrae]|uniref:Bifunctional pyr operon transcriptional regulator/uracil phosphoribosyltransferase PyrR n=1 Tax=Paraburkholderia silviterrae TaxID=2528715 RepID=A0A4R5LYM4_9BURK|nr:bifunctional pyr operon transcriptional regulator/uracil phosphoribosyltransferase PyrR [Paraburkholderia silviterrae]TDG17417.1 bifunctional pyr operon transcriptional regulator/uracil phosphoribosyltransferase PyrR [Paraburkholderia silviterrae]
MNTPDAEALYRAVLEQIRAAYPAGAFSAPDGVAIAGIHSGGAWLAGRLARDLGATKWGVVNVALHRDDYAKKGLHSQASPTALPFEVENRRILLVDDVLHTGRTVRAALNELYDYGRPACVEVAVLVERGGRELPVSASFVGGEVQLDPGSTLVLERADDGHFALRIEPRDAH